MSGCLDAFPWHRNACCPHRVHRLVRMEPEDLGGTEPTAPGARSKKTGRLKPTKSRRLGLLGTGNTLRRATKPWPSPTTGNTSCIPLLRQIPLFLIPPIRLSEPQRFMRALPIQSRSSAVALFLRKSWSLRTLKLGFCLVGFGAANSLSLGMYSLSRPGLKKLQPSC